MIEILKESDVYLIIIFNLFYLRIQIYYTNVPKQSLLHQICSLNYASNSFLFFKFFIRENEIEKAIDCIYDAM